MKKLILLFLLSTKLIAQPSGKLYVHTNALNPNDGILGYISYPSGTYFTFASVYGNDFSISGDSLFLAGNNIYIYDLISNTLVDSIVSVAASRIERWNNSLVVTMQQSPYFRVYDLTSHTLSYSFDSLKITQPPIDLLVEGNLAYLASTDSITIVDLMLGDTIAKIFTPHPFPFAGMNQFLVSKDNNLFIVVNYATGAARFSLVQMDKSNYNVTTSFHYEGTECFRQPVLVEDSIFMTFYNSHYSIPQDTFLVVPNSTSNAVAYDHLSQSIFINDFSTNGIMYDQNGILSTSVGLSYYLTKAIWVADHTSDIHTVDNSHFNIFPNPASNKIKLTLNNETNVEEIYIYDITGKLFYSKKINQSISEYEIDIKYYSDGNYFIQIVSDKNTFNEKFNVIR